MKFALTAAFVFAAFTGAASAETLERGNGADPTTLDPQRATTAAEANILRDLYEGLVTYDAAGNLIPGAATSWTISDDRLTYTFQLRVASWSNRLPVTAADFEKTFRRLFDPTTEAPDAPLFDAIAGASAMLAGEVGPDALGVRVIDSRTLVIELAEPNPMFLHALARPAAMPLYRGFNTVARIPEVNQPTNGPYRFDGYEPGVGLWLIRSETYHDAEAVAFEQVVYRPYDRQRALAAFAAGEILISNDVPAFALGELAETFGDAFREATHAGSFFLAANPAGPLADPSLRRAVALAIDRIRLSDGIWLGAMIPTLSLLPPGLADQMPPAEAGLGPNDPAARQAEARVLIAAAGYTAESPLELTIAVSDTGLQQETGAAIVENLAAVGIAATLVIRPSAAHHAALTGDRDYDLATVGWIGLLGHVEEFLGLFAEGDVGIVGYTDPAYESFLAEARITADATVRAALYAAADRLIAADLLAIPLMHYASLNLVSTELVGWEDNAIDVHLSRWLGPPPPPEEGAE